MAHSGEVKSPILELSLVRVSEGRWGEGGSRIGDGRHSGKGVCRNRWSKGEKKKIIQQQITRYHANPHPLPSSPTRLL